jgi:rare lipoprotein A
MTGTLIFCRLRLSNFWQNDRIVGRWTRRSWRTSGIPPAPWGLSALARRVWLAHFTVGWESKSQKPNNSFTSDGLGKKMRFRFASRAFLITLLALIVASCAENETHGVYKVGQPYQIEGVWYYPKEDQFYDETGIASWYGQDFHGKNTANGELYDMDTLTAAHRTLPLPVIVRVTNLENGRSLLVRVNDRGPYARGRIIDLSRRSAQLLGFYDKGTARVRVQYEGRAEVGGSAPTGGVEMASAQPSDVHAAPIGSVARDELAPPPGAAAAPSRTTAPPVRVASTAPVGGAQSSMVPDGTVTTVPVPVRTQLWVQVGAFQARNNADRLAMRLRSVGAASVSTVNQNGKALYRVRFGPLANVDDADAMLNKIIDRGENGAQIVVD